MAVGMRFRAMVMPVLAVGVLLSGGCVSPVVEDNRAHAPELVVSRSLSPKLYAQARLSRTSGGSNQLRRLERNGDLELGAVHLEEPEQLAGDFTLDYLTLGLGLQAVDRPRFDVRVDAGLRVAQLDLTLEDEQGGRYQYSGRNVGPGLSISLQFPLRERLSGEVYADSAVYVMDDDGYQKTWGLRLVFDAHERVKLFAGWREVDYQNFEHPSRIQILASGLNAGLALKF